ncbi:NAD(P)-dependent oxidoreductase [Candidatus Woesearchaeota archaeon]|nr:NAD(P)-dependent oxidoreductase [Candidatus Woesearchaeota archaeon]
MAAYKKKPGILVTGASGFIGRHLVAELSEIHSRRDILCLVHENSSSFLEITGRDNLKKLGLSYMPVDLMDKSTLKKVPKNPRIVYHLASITDTSVKDHSVNDVGTKNLIEAIGSLNKSTHFLYTSSIAVTDNRKDYSHPINENSPFDEPANEYGRRKLLTEKYLIKKCKEMGFRLSIMRVPAVYGIGARTGGLFDGTHKMVINGSFITRLNWPGKMSIANVNDLVRFLIMVSGKKSRGGHYEIYTPSSEAITFADISRIIHRAYVIPYRPIKLPNLFWRACSIIAAKKQFIQHFVPHKAYNRIWQASILVNNEYWNVPKGPGKFPDWKPISFEEYYKELVK